MKRFYDLYFIIKFLCTSLLNSFIIQPRLKVGIKINLFLKHTKDIIKRGIQNVKSIILYLMNKTIRNISSIWSFITDYLITLKISFLNLIQFLNRNIPKKILYYIIKLIFPLALIFLNEWQEKTISSSKNKINRKMNYIILHTFLITCIVVVIFYRCIEMYNQNREEEESINKKDEFTRSFFIRVYVYAKIYSLTQ
jgi:hypothetical protein